MTQSGFAAQLGVGTRTVQRWERGAAAPDAAAEAALLAYCETKGLYQDYRQGVLAGLTLSPDRLRDLLAKARLGAGDAASGPGIVADKAVTILSAAVRLPSPLTGLVGREQDIAEVVERLRGGRLLTLTGPGGVGKTRVAQAAAEALVDDFADGVVFVALASISDPSLILSTTARALGLPASGGLSPLAILTNALRKRTLLLVLDNLEQVLDAAGDIVDLVSACPGLKVLATSRAPLRVGGEREYPVSPLPVPDPAHLPPLAVLSAIPAVRLFCERGRDVRPDFDLVAENAAPVAAVCARLDGLPLALELAAARLKIFSPQALLNRLDHRLSVLTGGRRDLPARQRTLRDTIAWSYDLLAPVEQVLFRRLAVFAGGCTHPAMESVCHAEGDPDVDLLDGVAALVDHSLLRREAGAEGEPRYWMLETLREFAREQLARSGELESIHQRHADFFLAQAEQADRSTGTGERPRWHDQLEVEHDNLRAALSWCAATGDAERGLRLGTALFWFWNLQGHAGEGRARLDDAVARALSLGEARGHPSVPTRLLARALSRAGGLAWHHGDLAAAAPRLEQALALARELGDQHTVAFASEYLGLTALHQGDHARARPRFEVAVGLFRETGDRWALADALSLLADASPPVDGHVAEALYEESLALYRELDDPWAALPLAGLGRLALHRGDYVAARALTSESLALRRADRSQWMLAAISLASLGEVARCEGDLEQARELFLEGLALSRELAGKSTIAWSLCGLGHVTLKQGDSHQAAALFADSLVLARDLGQTLRIAACLVGLAGLAQATDQHERAARLLGAAESLCNMIVSALEPADQLDYGRYLAVARSALSEEMFGSARAAGLLLSVEQAVAGALNDVVAPHEDAAR